MSEATKRRAPWIGRAIRAGQRYHVRTKRPLVHNAINLAAVISLLAAIVFVAWCGGRMAPWLYLLWAPFVFGFLYFGTFVLVVHEASHGLFLISSRRRVAQKLNRAAGWCVAVFFATHYGKHWEVGHLEHHVRPLEPMDPQAANTIVGRELFRRASLCVFVPGYLFLDRLVFRKKPKGGKSSSSAFVIVLFVVLWSSVVALATMLVGWQSGVALFLGVNVIVGLNYIKGALEHGGAIGHEADSFLRSRSSFFFARHLLMPFNITLHFEHHLNYRIPWYDLVRYHRDLEAIVPPEIAAAVWNHRPMAQLRGELGGVTSL